MSSFRSGTESLRKIKTKACKKSRAPITSANGVLLVNKRAIREDQSSMGTPQYLGE